MEKPLVSVIIPVYNTKIALLSNCLESLDRQTYSNIEIIIVDDGSINEIAEYLDSLRNKSYIKVIHQDNSGTSVARNTGITNVNGKYFAFFDSDDTCSDDLIEKLVCAAENTGSDLCIAGFKLISDVTKEEIGGTSNKYTCTLDMNDANRLSILQQTFHYVASNISLQDKPYSCSTNELWLQGKIWGKLYRTDVYKHIRFVEKIIISEDAIYTIDILKNSQKISFVSSTYYYYYMNDGSVSRKKWSVDGIAIRNIAMWEKLKEYPDVFAGMYSALTFGDVKGCVGEYGILRGHRIIKDYCLKHEIREINKSLSMSGIAHAQEKRTRVCLKRGWIFLLLVIAKLSTFKEYCKKLRCNGRTSLLK